MGIIVSKEDDLNTDLTERINADLRESVQENSEPLDKDFAENSEYIKELNQTGRFSWIWPVLICLSILSLISILIF